MASSYSKADILAELAKRGVNIATIGVDASAPGAAYLSNGGGRPLSAATEKELSGYRQGAQNALSARSSAMRFQNLNKENRTGGIMGSLPFRDKFDPGFAEMKAIGEKLVPAQREPGSGVMSDRDVEMYRAATLSTGKPREANDALAKVIRAGSVRQADQAAFMEEWAKRNGGLTGAQEAWNAYAEANPLFRQEGGNTQVNGWTPWRQWFGVDMKPAQGGQAQGGAQPGAKNQRPPLSAIFGGN